MFQQGQVSNPNDFKVVVFKNPYDFTFTPEMGCMYDSRPIFGITGAPGINGGESMTLPYHVGQRLAINLAKAFLTRQAPATDPAGIPTGVPLWDTPRLEVMKNSYITELYSEAKPVGKSETDLLMAKVEELRKLVETSLPVTPAVPAPEVVTAPVVSPPAVENTPEIKIPVTSPTVYKDKAEVIAELEKRQVQHDKRKSKAELEKLLA